MNLQTAKFCFCTLAFGKNYRNLALLLAKDLEKYSPDTPFLILTDEPRDFSEQPNVLAFKHQQQSVKLYHDKRFAIAKGLSLFNSCIFLDADMRILAPVPQDMEWIKTPGINARACDIMPKKYAKVFAGNADSKLIKEFKVTKNIAQKLNLELNDGEVKFVYEYLFAITKYTGKEIEFLNQWETIAAYYELNGVYNGEGNAIGIAAAKAGLPVRWCAMDGINFFKDKTELVRLQKGESAMQDMKIYFDQQKNLEYPQQSLIKKAIIKIRKQIHYLYYLLRLRIVTLKKFDFYYR
jgi:hypothetical protein